MVPDPGNVGNLKNLRPAQWNIKGNAGLIHRVFGKPLLEPARSLAQLGRDLIERHRARHQTTFTLTARKRPSFPICSTYSTTASIRGTTPPTTADLWNLVVFPRREKSPRKNPQPFAVSYRTTMPRI
jgi:hypothetical protein